MAENLETYAHMKWIAPVGISSCEIYVVQSTETIHNLYTFDDPLMSELSELQGIWLLGLVQVKVLGI